jgi:tetratricopeptide (TPR) repeat protein
MPAASIAATKCGVWCRWHVRLLAIVLVSAVAISGGVGVAAPKYTHTASTSTDPAVVAAERAWTVAAASRPAQSDLWEDAATAFLAIVDAGTLSRSELALASSSALAALKNSVMVDPRAKAEALVGDHMRASEKMSAREQRMIHLLEVAARHQTDPNEIAGLDFQRANILRRHDQFDLAIPIYLYLITNHRTHEVAEYSANLLLDIYNRMERYDDLVALAKKLRADKAFLAHRPELAGTVKKVFAQSQATEARQALQLGRDTGEHVYFDQCAEAFLAILDPASPDASDDAVLFNATECFDEGGSIERALATLKRLVTEHPNSTLAKRAMPRSIHMLSLIGRFEEAATTGETWLRSNAIERDAADVLEDTIRMRMALGPLDTALHTYEQYAKSIRRLPQLLDRSALVAMTLARALLVANRRADALRLLARPPTLSRTTRDDTASRMAVANVYAAAACPVLLVDELCPRARDESLMATARRELTQIHNPSDAGTLLLANLALEAIVNKRGRTANLAADYQHLASSADAEIRTEAHARLAMLAKYIGDTAEQQTQLEACVVESVSSGAGDKWRAICDRDVAGGREILPEPARGPVPLALDPPPRRRVRPHASSTIDFD